jgi:hypothetical protein
MQIRRYCISNRNTDGSLVVAQYASVERSWEVGAKVLCRCVFEDANESANLVAAQADPNVVVFPSETAPASVMPAATQTAVTSVGGSTSGAQVLDAVRSIRNGMVASGHKWFDISSAQ